MKNEFNDALILLAKCAESHKTYGIRVERQGDKFVATWAFPIKEASAKREDYDKTTIRGIIHFSDEYPGCPYCGAKSGLTVCDCGHLGCTIVKDGVYTCEWCGATGRISAYTGEDIKAGMDI